MLKVLTIRNNKYGGNYINKYRVIMIVDFALYAILIILFQNVEIRKVFENFIHFSLLIAHSRCMLPATPLFTHYLTAFCCDCSYSNFVLSLIKYCVTFYHPTASFEKRKIMSGAEVIPPPVHRLPTEVLEYILGLVSPYRDLHSCKLVCKRWLDIVRGITYSHPII